MSIRYVLFIGFTIRVLFFSFLYNVQDWNIHMALRFDERALAILNGQPMANLAGWGSYPLFLSAIYKVLDVVHLLEYRLAIIFWLYQFVGLLTALVVLKILEHIKASKKMSLLVVAILLILNPLQIYINSLNISESLFQLTSVLALALYLGCFRLNEWARWILFFVCLALSVIARNIIIPFILLLPLYLFFFEAKGRQHLVSNKFWSGAVVAIFLLWGAGQINARSDSHKDTSLNSNRGANIAQTWCEATVIDFKTAKNGFWYTPPAFWPLEKTRSLYLDHDFEDTKYYSNLAWRCLKKDPSLIILRTQSILNVFTGPLYPHPLKQRFASLEKVYSGLYLAVFIFLILGARTLYKNPTGRFLMFYILTNLAAVFIGNTGEARFLYSFLPALVILLALLLKFIPMKRGLLLGTISIFVMMGLFFIEPMDAIISARDKERFQALTENQKNDLIYERINLAPKIEENKICKGIFPEAEKCLDENICDEKQLVSIFEKFKRIQSFPMTEVTHFCRNLTMVKLMAEKNIQIPLPIIQKPSALPEGLDKNFHPIEGIAGQLLHAELLKSIGQSDMMPANESHEELLYTLLKYQHRYDFNRPEYRGVITGSLQTGVPSIEAAQIYVETLKQIIKSR